MLYRGICLLKPTTLLGYRVYSGPKLNLTIVTVLTSSLLNVGLLLRQKLRKNGLNFVKHFCGLCTFQPTSKLQISLSLFSTQANFFAVKIFHSLSVIQTCSQQRWSPRGHILKSLALASRPQVLENWPVLGSRTAVFFELLKFCEALEKFFGKRCFVEIG